MHSHALEELKRDLHLSKEQVQWLYGILLGDGHLETQNGGRTYRLKIEQSFSHKLYVDWLFSLFSDFVRTPPRERIHFAHGKPYRKYGFQTVSVGAFRFFAHQFYAGKRKKVPRQIGKWLSPHSLATWFMDDGSIKSHATISLILHTHSFSRQEIELLIRVLLERWQIAAKPRRQRDGIQIFIPAHEAKKFYTIVKPYIHPSMFYKFPQKLMNSMPKG